MRERCLTACLSAAGSGRRRQGDSQPAGVPGLAQPRLPAGACCAQRGCQCAKLQSRASSPCVLAAAAQGRRPAQAEHSVRLDGRQYNLHRGTHFSLPAPHPSAAVGQQPQ